MVSKTGAADLFGKSAFVFVGRVLRPGTSNVRLVGKSEGTAVVRVEEVLHGTPATRDLAGRDVTVAVKEAKGLEAGKSYFFFTARLLFGENVAAQEVGRIEVSEAAEELRGHIKSMSKEAADSPLKERLRGAKAVVVGTTTALAKAKTRPRKWSEHDPDWWIAKVAISSALKGEAKGEVEVLFANSTDIAWYKAPKFRPGTAGIVLLRKERVEDVEGDYFVAIHPLDLLPTPMLSEVRRLLGVKEPKEEEG